MNRGRLGFLGWSLPSVLHLNRALLAISEIRDREESVGIPIERAVQIPATGLENVDWIEHCDCLEFEVIGLPPPRGRGKRLRQHEVEVKTKAGMVSNDDAATDAQVIEPIEKPILGANGVTMGLVETHGGDPLRWLGLLKKRGAA
jgi:hypothetical protein